jgi:hypothetical protein
VSGLVLYPYLLNGDLFAQNTRLQLTQENELKVDYETSRLVDSLLFVLKSNTSFQAGDMIYSNSEQFGLVYLVGGVVPGLGFYPRTHSSASMQVLAVHLPKKDANLLFLVDSAKEMSPDFIACVNQAGIDYPKEYINTGNFRYRLPWTSEVKTLSLLVPKSKLKR